MGIHRLVLHGARRASVLASTRVPAPPGGFCHARRVAARGWRDARGARSGFVRLTVVGIADGALDRPICDAWRAFSSAAVLPSRVHPAVPILFFGDLAAYEESPLRVLIAGLNPSLHEFPESSPFRRFPLAEGAGAANAPRYIAALSAYFRTDPYRQWFGAFEPLLNGSGASYYPGHPSTALHTDICSPVATNPTWTGLDDLSRSALEAQGGPLWHSLLETLRPHVVALSVARRHLGRIEFEPLTAWEPLVAFQRTASGEPRSRPVQVAARWYDVAGEPSLFVFGPAAQTPLGLLGAAQRREVGTRALEAWRHER